MYLHVQFPTLLSHEALLHEGLEMKFEPRELQSLATHARSYGLKSKEASLSLEPS